MQRCGKSCRLRWINYLRPDLKKGSFSAQEEKIIIDVHRILGNRWAQIAKHLPGRTDNEVKNFWNSCIKKKLIAQGLDPNTHNLFPCSKSTTKAINHNNTANIACNFSHRTLQKPSSSSVCSIINDDHLISPPPAIPQPLQESSIISIREYQSPSMVWSTTINDILHRQNIPSQPSMGSSTVPKSSSSVPFDPISEFEMNIYNGKQYCIWDSTSSFEPTVSSQDEILLMQQQQPEKINIHEWCEAEQNMIDYDSLFESSNFDFGFVESALVPCGMSYAI